LSEKVSFGQFKRKFKDENNIFHSISLGRIFLKLISMNGVGYSFLVIFSTFLLKKMANPCSVFPKLTFLSLHLILAIKSTFLNMSFGK